MAAPVQVGIPADSVGQDATEQQRWTPRLILSLTSIVLLLELLSISYWMITMAMPSIAGHFQTTQGAWLLTSFLLVGAMAAPLIGKLADMYGKRKLLLACVAVAALGSFISAVAPSYAVLIVGRCLTGLLIPCLFLSYSLIRDVFPAKTVAIAVSIATSGMGLIAIPAPFITGWLIDNHGFRSIFWFSVVGLVVLGAMLLLTTDESTVRLRSRLDILGAVLLGSGIAGILVGISFGPTWGWKSGSILTYLLGGAALVVAWLVTAGTVKEPLIDLKVLRRRSVAFTATAAGFMYGVSTLFTMLLPMLAMTPAIMGLGYGFGVDAEGYAVFQAPFGAMTVIGGLIVGMLVGRNVRPRPLLAIGAISAAVGCAVTAYSHDSKITLIVTAGLVGLGAGMGYAAIPNLLIEAVPPQLQASTASIVGAFQSVFPAALPVIAFTVMNNSHIAPIPPEMTQGAVFYTDQGFQVGFMIAAAAAVLGALVALMIPRKIEQLQVPSAPTVADDGTVVAAHA
ncbi:MFS transporter [Rhodococcus sp. NPDC127528]|uniref:MFS transporter n=1 Tax=unclassified Rhodococcus (in: high G+C Gram-positive bacteria) TaxID=192944 RepID=UPI00363D938E